jgi:hypothetical protein
MIAHGCRLLVALVGLLPHASLGFTWESYAPATIHQVILLHGDERERSTDGTRLINTADEKYRLTVTYLGSQRPVPPARRKLISDWVQAVALDPQVATWFRHEIQVLEGKDAYWLPVQEAVLPHMTKELSSGDQIDVYVMFIGHTAEDWMFLVNEFDNRNTQS